MSSPSPLPNGSLTLKRLQVRDMPSLFQALTPWEPTWTIGSNYLGNMFYAIVRVHDDRHNDHTVICSNFMTNQTFCFSETWVPAKGADFYLHIYDFLLGKGWG